MAVDREFLYIVWRWCFLAQDCVAQMRSMTIGPLLSKSYQKPCVFEGPAQQTHQKPCVFEGPAQQTHQKPCVFGPLPSTSYQKPCVFEGPAQQTHQKPCVFGPRLKKTAKNSMFLVCFENA